jgi:hypothetical protein
MHRGEALFAVRRAPGSGLRRLQGQAMARRARAAAAFSLWAAPCLLPSSAPPPSACTPPRQLAFTGGLRGARAGGARPLRERGTAVRVGARAPGPGSPPRLQRRARRRGRGIKFGGAPPRVRGAPQCRHACLSVRSKGPSQRVPGCLAGEGRRARPKGAVLRRARGRAAQESGERERGAGGRGARKGAWGGWGSGGRAEGRGAGNGPPPLHAPAPRRGSAAAGRAFTWGGALPGARGRQRAKRKGRGWLNWRPAAAPVRARRAGERGGGRVLEGGKARAAAGPWGGGPARARPSSLSFVRRRGAGRRSLHRVTWVGGRAGRFMAAEGDMAPSIVRGAPARGGAGARRARRQWEGGHGSELGALGRGAVTFVMSAWRHGDGRVKRGQTPSLWLRAARAARPGPGRAGGARGRPRSKPPGS